MTAVLDTVTVRTAGDHEARFAVRPDTNDSALVYGILGGAEYPFDRLQGLTGWAIDIGAHIGIVSVALALDNPDLRIVAVEALPENANMLRTNIGLNGLGGRVLVEEAAASDEQEFVTRATVDVAYGWSHAPNQPDGYLRDSRYIGGMVAGNESSQIASCRALSLGAILEQYGIEDVALVKIDCEGCEWFFLRSPDIAKVRHIVGEMHIGRHGQANDLRAMLEPTHTVTMDDAKVVAIFEAVRR